MSTSTHQFPVVTVKSLADFLGLRHSSFHGKVAFDVSLTIYSTRGNPKCSSLTVASPGFYKTGFANKKMAKRACLDDRYGYDVEFIPIPKADFNKDYFQLEITIAQVMRAYTFSEAVRGVIPPGEGAHLSVVKYFNYVTGTFFLREYQELGMKVGRTHKSATCTL